MEVERGKLQWVDKKRSLNESQKEKIFDRDSWICQYCGDRANNVDHIIPWAYTRDNTKENLVASCQLCNLIAGSKTFDSFQEKKLYILNRLLKILGRANQVVWTKTELSEIHGRLRKFVRENSIIVETEEEKTHIEIILRKKRESISEYIVFRDEEHIEY